MHTTLPQPLLAQLSELLALQMGLYYPAKRWGDLERGIIAAAPALGMANTEKCVRQLLSASLTRSQIEILARYLTVGETYFFREKGSFDVLEEHIFPELLRACTHANRQLRIWSAGCCTGEEPYSIAMLLDRLIRDRGEWNATILATDINPTSLQKAAEGVYGEWSFRSTPLWVKERYFKRRKNGQFEILPHIRKRVHFSYLNLVEDVYPSLTNDTHSMDVIFCRNVLMYFSPEWIRKIGQNFHRSLANGGWLIVSPVEISNSLFYQFKATTFPGVIFYHRTEDPASQVKTANHSASITHSQLNSLCVPAPSLPQAFCLPAVINAPPATVKARHTTSSQATNFPQAGHEEHDAFCRTARSYADQGKLTEAIKWCERAIAANKLNPSAHYLLAIVRQELGQSETAMQSLMHTLYLDPDFVLAHFALGNLCLSQTRYGDAERHFGNALSLLHPHPYDKLLPESGGLTAGRLREIITSATKPAALGRRNIEKNPR